MAKGFDLSKLNGPQREAASTHQGPVLILAGAGTGKTRTITARIAHMVSSGIAPGSILAVTFTNKAANEMKERVRGMVARGAASKLTLCTFHSLCVRLLRRDITKLGYKSNFTIYTGSEQTGLIRRILVRRGGRDLKIEPGVVIAAISSLKNRGVGPTAEEDPFLHMVWEEYEREKRALNAVDFDDLLVLGSRLLEKHSETASYWGERFRYIMVDEFQDTNRLQMDLLRRLCGTEHNVCVVGDDDQSIYGWRGAEITNILRFERFFPDPKVIKLEENYRSTMPILQTANSLIRHNTGRREKRLWSRNSGEEKVRVVLLPDDREEARFVISGIEAGHYGEGMKWESFAVLFRTNRQSRLFEEELRERRIPYRMIGGQSFFDRREIKDVLAYLTLMENPDDDIHLLRVLNTPPRGISTKTAEEAIAVSRERECSVWRILCTGGLGDRVSARATNAVAAFVEMIVEFTEASRENAAAAIRGLLERIEFSDFIRRSCKTPEEANSREEAVESFLGDLDRHLETHPKAGLRGFLDSVALNGDRDNDDDLEKKKGVSLITMHAAKGLEFPVVYVSGVEEGFIPHKRALEDGSLDEERRLFYVGLTRAMKRLILTVCITRNKWGQQVGCQPSRFLDELDPEHVESADFQSFEPPPLEADQVGTEVKSILAMLQDIEDVDLR